jgi:spermidine synthase
MYVCMFIYACVCVYVCVVYHMLDAIRDFKTPQKVLILGVGRSNVVEVLYAHGFRDITCIDISPQIISQMQNKYRKYSGVDCK